MLLDIYIGKSNTQAYLETIPFVNEKREILDSVTLINKKATIFTIPYSEERSYKIRFANSRLEIIFINDSPKIIIHGNIYQPFNYTFEHSPASSSIKKFIDEKVITANELKSFSNQLKNLNQIKYPGRLDSIKRNFNHKVADINQRAIDFADTISNPAGFLFVYNSIDFGNNYTNLKDFILRNARRFPLHSGVQKLKNKTLAYLKIFEEDYHIGDQIPNIILPDQYGQPYSTASLKGKYYLLNFWSSWCDICMNYIPPEKRLKNIISPDKFEIIHIAIDSEKEHWKSTISLQKMDWPQLIDEQMWEGQAIRTYKIDSIPFNFLISPEGKVLKKGIPADSIIYYSKKYIK